MKLLYFAWLKEKTGVGEEEIALPDGGATVQDRVLWLRGRCEGYAEDFADETVVRTAVNQEYVTLEAPVAEDDEVAFFPPVTGGRSA